MDRDSDKIFRLYCRLILENSQEDMNIQPPAPEKKHTTSMTPEEFKEFEIKLLQAKAILYRNYTFLSLILSKLRTVPTFDLDTMGVDDAGNIYINPDFVNKLTLEETVGVLAHETLHIANLTHSRRNGRDPKLWNICTDYIMNRDLLEMGITLPPMGLLPVNKYGRWVIEGIPSIKDGELTDDPLDITNMSAERLYNIMPHILAQSEGLFEQLTAAQEEFDAHIENQGTPTPADTSSNSDVYKPQNLDLNPTERRNAVTQAVIAADTAIKQSMQDTQDVQRGRGVGPSGYPRSWNPKWFQAKTNWRQLLKNFVTKSRNTESTWSRIRKRAQASGYYAPSYKPVNDRVDIIVGVDTSASIPNKVIDVFNNEIIKIAKSFKEVRMRIVFWNDRVTGDVLIDTTKMSINSIKRKLTAADNPLSGTTLSCVKQYLDAKGIHKIEGLIILTDGWIEPDPQIPNAKRKLFCITQGGSDSILKNYGPCYEIDISYS